MPIYNFETFTKALKYHVNGDIAQNNVQKILQNI